jgi:carbon-monoxide dehydrogenase medium subunit
MSGFTFTAPTTVDEVLGLLGDHGQDATLLAGGQSLMILLRQRLVSPEVVVGLKQVTELRDIASQDDHIEIGSMVTYRSASQNTLLRDKLPVLAKASGSVGTVHIRALGTLGGSVCHADPSGDVPTVLLMYGATLVLRKQAGSEVHHDIDDFFTGVFETRREPDELLVAIRVPHQPSDATYSYRRYSFREGEYPLCVVACRLTWDGERCTGARIAVGGAGPHPHRITEIEQRITGQEITAVDVPSLTAGIPLQPMPDVRGTSEWKAGVVRHVIEEALTEALEGAVRHG